MKCPHFIFGKISEEGEAGVGDPEEAGEAREGDGGRGAGGGGVGEREPPQPGPEDGEGGADHGDFLLLWL